ncbi:MAG TPA: hypothetical protein VGS20_03925 [Candidatus Acidoferrales bacterium]|nr:hypothetical protein [Candidatus Acidoferrales bacterium]
MSAATVSANPRQQRRWLPVAVAVAAAAALAALSIDRLVTLAGWERALVFARDLLPPAIGAEVMTLAAYAALLVLLVWGRGRRWGLALAIAWGAITAGAWLWPHATNLWYELAWRLRLSSVLRHVVVVAGPELRLTRWRAALGLALAVSSAKAFADLPRRRLDRGVLEAGAFFAVFYFLAIRIVASFLVVR